MKVIESYWKGTMAVCLILTEFSVKLTSDFPSKVCKISFDQTKEREKCFGFIT